MKNLPVVLLAGGLGTRLSSISSDKPKALLPLAGKPFLYWKLNELLEQGVSKIYLLLGYGSEHIEGYLREHVFNCEIVIIRDKPNCRGTAQALLDALNEISEDQFILTYGDNLLPMPIADFVYPLDEAHCRMVTTTNIGLGDTPNAIVHGGNVVAYGKETENGYIELDYGYSLISKNCLVKYAGDKATDLAPVFSMMAEQGVLEAHRTGHPYVEIGTPRTYSKADEQLRNKFK